MKLKCRILTIMLLMASLLSGSHAASFSIYPNPGQYLGTGIGLFITTSAGTYTCELTIREESTKGLVHYYKTENFVIKNAANNHLIHVWNVRNDDGYYVAPGPYIASITLTNKATDAATTISHNVGVSGSDTWMSDMRASVFTDQYQDKIYRFPTSTPGASKKAIICLKGWDPMNNVDGAEICFKYWDLYSGATNERAKGWDLYFPVWKDAGISLKTNAQRAIEMIKLINQSYGSYSEITVIGISMGAILGRFALSKCENDGISLPVTKFISIEGEHQGAQVNLTMQAAVHQIVTSGNILWKIGSWSRLGEAVTIQDYNEVLYAPASKEMLYYHVGLVESYLPFDISRLDEIRSYATVWHDNFYQDLSMYGRGPGGYPSFCKNYSISFATSEPYYTDKSKNQNMANLVSPIGTSKLYSDIQDLDQASYIDLRNNANYSPVNGYNAFMNFVRLESALDLQDISFAKKGERIIQKMSTADLNKYSRFDKVFVRPDGLRLDHNSPLDDEVIENIRTILADTQPKGECKVFSADYLPGIINLTTNQ